MKVVVFGGAGFVGSHVVDALVARGHDVVVFDIAPSPHLPPGQTMVVGDILDRALVERTVAGAQVVYHFAGLADLDACRRMPVATAQANVVGTATLLEACANAGVSRFVYASTIYVYSTAGSFYRVSKQAAEGYIEEFQRQGRLHFTILRYGTLYGPRADAANSVQRFLESALRHRRIEYAGSGDEIREYIHVADAARCSVDILASEYEDQHIVLTGHHPMRVRDLLSMIQEMVGNGVDVAFGVEAAPGHADHYTVTPYSYQPRLARKLVSAHYLDMGQGLLECLEALGRTGTDPRA